ncbi:hypothetical protein BHM03_00008269 [Ensete ventricosum]|nr:hypothetical protein BHM03_00008269 [Ensete ventricosum]
MARLPRRRWISGLNEGDDGGALSASSEELQCEPLPEKEVPSDRPVRVYADGIYDLFHFGHARALEQAKNSFPNTYLLVGCCNDEITHRYKGNTVMTESERYESLRHCRFVVLHSPYDWETFDTQMQVELEMTFMNMLVLLLPLCDLDGISTSDIIMRILKNYNKYVMRNLARGFLSFCLEIMTVSNCFLQLHTVAKTAGMHQNEWVENADRCIAGFLGKFEERCHIMVGS